MSSGTVISGNAIIKRSRRLVLVFFDTCLKILIVGSFPLRYSPKVDAAISKNRAYSLSVSILRASMSCLKNSANVMGIFTTFGI